VHVLCCEQRNSELKHHAESEEAQRRLSFTRLSLDPLPTPAEQAEAGKPGAKKRQGSRQRDRGHMLPGGYRDRARPEKPEGMLGVHLLPVVGVEESEISVPEVV
jgi:hypothetical protein